MGRCRARATRRSRTSTRCRSCTRSSRRHGVRPTYVVTWPVADRERPTCCALLHAGGDCEIGAHHHAWETPPFTPEDVKRHPYALDAAARAVRGAARGADGGDRARGRRPRPVSYRSGRFGFSAAHVAALERHGYLVESSVAPLFYEAHKGGPDFVDAPLTPYFLAYDQRHAAGHERRAGAAALGRAAPPAAARGWRWPTARAPKPYHDQAGAAEAGHRAHAVAAAVLLVARGHVRARPPPGRRRRAAAEPALPLERGDRRRQPVQSHRGASWTRSSTGSIASWRSRRPSSAPCR